MFLNCGDSLVIVLLSFIQSVLKEKVVNEGEFESSREIIVEESSEHQSIVIVLKLSILDGALVFVKELVNSIGVVWMVLEDGQFPLHCTDVVPVHSHVFLNSLQVLVEEAKDPNSFMIELPLP